MSSVDTAANLTLENLKKRYADRDAAIKLLPLLDAQISADIRQIGQAAISDPDRAAAYFELGTELFEQLQRAAQAKLGMVPEKPAKKTPPFMDMRPDLVNKLKSMWDEEKGGFSVDDLTHLLTVPRNPKFNPDRNKDRAKAVDFLRRVSAKAEVKIPRGGEGLSLKQSMRILGLVDQQVQRAPNTAYRLVDAPAPKK